MTLRFPRVGLARFPAGLLGMIAIVACVESYVAARDTDFLGTVEWDWKLGGRAARGAGRPAEVLSLGDSMVKMGVAPRVLETRLGLPTRSLALLDGKPPATYFLLRRALESGAKPRAVIVDFQPECLSETEQSRLGKPQWTHLLTIRECLDLAWTERDATFVGRFLAGRLSPSYSRRWAIRESVVVALLGGSGSKHPGTLPFRRNWVVNHGGQVMGRNPVFRGGMAGYDWPAVVRDLPGTPGATRYVDRFLTLAAARGIRVFWLITPFDAEAQARREGIGLDERFTGYVAWQVARFPNLVVLDARHSGYTPAAFVDPVHLNRDGATCLSTDVADAIQPYLGATAGGPAWVLLPRYRPEASDPTLEDTDQSRLVVAPSLERRR